MLMHFLSDFLCKNIYYGCKIKKECNLALKCTFIKRIFYYQVFQEFWRILQQGAVIRTNTVLTYIMCVQDIPEYSHPLVFQNYTLYKLA